MTIMSQGARYALAGAVLVLGFVLAIGISIYMADRAVSSSNTRWCDTLTLLTSEPVTKPANPEANPSREQSYKVYVNLVKLKQEFRCLRVVQGVS